MRDPVEFNVKFPCYQQPQVEIDILKYNQASLKPMQTEGKQKKFKLSNAGFQEHIQRTEVKILSKATQDHHALSSCWTRPCSQVHSWLRVCLSAVWIAYSNILLASWLFVFASVWTAGLLYLAVSRRFGQ